MKLRYFAWVRERAGITEEEVTLPDNVATVEELIAWLKTRGPEFAHAFENAPTIRAAIDLTHAEHDAMLTGASEIAFFPPVTGG
ncbi:MAG: molybdopterin converting factor subunit 1 [Rhizobiales bacterium]|nr:molybdopterin converting factor subunit 1 [Hyphomicrobiales bacterium]